jgi:tetratricopeptide (TPR) repeat protein
LAEPDLFTDDPEDILPQGPSIPDNTATALALEQTRREGPDVAADTSAFLRRQTHMLDLQMEHLHEQRALQLSHMWLRRWNERLKLMLQAMTIAVGTAVVAAIVAAAWQAHNDHALVIEPFSAPPDMAQKGLTGRVLASQLLDKLSRMQAQTDSARAPSTFKNNWGDDIKVEIPETGVSVGELLRALTKWLGHETHITGEVYGTDKGIAVTARAGEEPGDTLQGPASDLDNLMQQAAEAIYKRTQPYRYSVYLSQNGREQEAIQVLGDLAIKGPVEERAWAYIGWGGALAKLGDMQGEVEKARKGLRLDSHLAAGWRILASGEEALGHDQAAHDDFKTEVKRLSNGGFSGLSRAAAQQSLWSAQATLAEDKGDYLGAASIRQVAANSPDYNEDSFIAGAYRARDIAYSHDLADTASTLREPIPGKFALFARAATAIASARMTDNWAAALPILNEAEKQVTDSADARDNRPYWRTAIWPWLAYGYARMGRQEDADLLINSTPLDCYLCLRVRGLIAATRRDYAQADAWLMQAEKAAPSLPFAYAERGQVWMQKGDLSAAISQFRLAHAKGPAWADPLAFWGQVLMRKGDYTGAVGKFAEASRDAPHWAQLQQFWGQALDKRGDHAQALRHYNAAKALASTSAPTSD